MFLSHLFVVVVAALCPLLGHTSAFVVVPHNPTTNNRLLLSVVPSRRKLRIMAAVELEPEPEGGMELTAGTTIANCRMKQMEEITNAKSDDGPVYKFWMTAEAEGKLIKEIRTQILKDASKKADFPGFRKGQVPPYAQPQITQFAIQEAVIKTVEGAVEAYGLKSLAGSDGEVNVHEDVKDMSKGYKTGDSLQFTATLNCAYDPEKQSSRSSDESSGDVVDVEVTAEKEEA